MSELTSQSEPKQKEDSTLDNLVQYLRDEIGDDLHWVVSAEGNEGLEHKIHYLDNDVQEELYGNSSRQEIAQEMVFNTLEEEYLRDLYQLGDSQFFVEYFEGAALLKLLVNDGTARTVSVGVESTYEMDHTSVALECLEILENETS